MVKAGGGDGGESKIEFLATFFRLTNFNFLKGIFRFHKFM